MSGDEASAPAATEEQRKNTEKKKNDDNKKKKKKRQQQQQQQQHRKVERTKDVTVSGDKLYADTLAQIDSNPHLTRQIKSDLKEIARTDPEVTTMANHRKVVEARLHAMSLL